MVLVTLQKNNVSLFHPRSNFFLFFRNEMILRNEYFIDLKIVRSWKDPTATKGLLPLVVGPLLKPRNGKGNVYDEHPNSELPERTYVLKWYFPKTQETAK